MHIWQGLRSADLASIAQDEGVSDRDAFPAMHDKIIEKDLHKGRNVIVENFGDDSLEGG